MDPKTRLKMIRQDNKNERSTEDRLKQEENQRIEELSRTTEIFNNQ